MTFKPLEQILQITYTPKNKISQEQILILLKIKRRTQILTGYNSLATNCIVVFPSIQWSMKSFSNFANKRNQKKQSSALLSVKKEVLTGQKEQKNINPNRKSLL